MICPKNWGKKSMEPRGRETFSETDDVARIGCGGGRRRLKAYWLRQKELYEDEYATNCLKMMKVRELKSE